MKDKAYFSLYSEMLAEKMWNFICSEIDHRLYLRNRSAPAVNC